MATVRLYLDLGGYELPDVCMRCGAPATKRTSKVFSWHPLWPGLWPFVALMLTQRRRIEAPLCERHRYHWSARQAFLLGAAVASIGLVVALATLADPRPGQRPLLPDAAWLGLPLVLLVWLFPVRILQRQAIHPTEITTHTITLTGVSEGFVQAVDEKRGKGDRIHLPA
jgi:hypothetical protein